MYQDPKMLASIRKVEAAREENAKLDPRRMTAEEKDTLLKNSIPTTAPNSLPNCASAPTRAKGSAGTGGAAGGRIAYPARDI